MTSPAPDDSGSTALTPPMSTDDPGSRVGPNGQRLCSARRTNGEPCKGLAMTGQKVCRTHGGSAPQAKKKAALRLLELVDPAIATLAREMVQADGSADRQRAANSILDRAGVPRVTKEIGSEDSRAVLLTRLRELRESRPNGTHTLQRTIETIDYPSTPDSGDLTPNAEEAPHAD